MEKIAEELRDRLLKVIIKDMLSIKQVAKDMGVAYLTLDSFLYDKRKQHITILSRIKKYVEEREADGK